MRRNLRTAIVVGGIGATVLLALLVTAVVTRSWGWALAAVVLGCVLAAGASFLVARTAQRQRAANNRLSTLTRRLERQVAESAGRSRDLEARVEPALAEMSTGLAAVGKDVAVLRRRLPAGFLDAVSADVDGLASTMPALRRSSFETSFHLGHDPRRILSSAEAAELFRDYLERDELVALRPLIEHFDVLEQQKLSTLRRLYRFYRGAGYWELASRCITQVYAKSGRDTDARALDKIRREIDLFANPTLVTVGLDETGAHDPTGPIVHMVGRVLPETQTGYTLRTQYTVMAQLKKGLPVAVVAQSGVGPHPVEETEHYRHEGVDHYLLAGGARNELLIDEWLRQNIVELDRLVKRLRPSVLHAHSDFFNALIVHAVGRANSIPTVYESRGFWEESWLSRTSTKNGWAGHEELLFALYGRPEAYQLRKHAEEVARTLVDHVFTLAEVMRDYILDSASGAIAGDDVSIVPNAVEAERFPVQERDDALAAELGLPPGAVTIGYISSIVEYEGIDTLIEAFRLASAATDRAMCLLLVGDGGYLPTLRELVESHDIKNVFFTGRVPHEDVLRYYGLIDVFVVPRKPATVADLVTPLKPFEAFSTGRAVVLSDVGALREIAAQSGAAESFRAGAPDDLARVLIALIEDPERRRELSRRGARWVRNHRSWDRNVNEYYRIYRKLGYSGPGSLVAEAELRLEERGINAGELLETLADARVPAVRGKGWFSIDEFRQSAKSVLEEGWRYESFEPVPVARIKDWSRYGAEHRSWGFRLHAWEFMDPLIRAFDETGERCWLAEAVQIARNWLGTHRGLSDDHDPMVWYDMSQSLRTPRLIGLVLRAARCEEMRDDAVILAEGVAWHLDELHKDRAYNPHNNHGFYCAVAQLHAGKYAWMFPDAEATASEGRERLTQIATTQFARDGVHLEHSPDYHRMLLKSFELAVNDGLIDDPEIEERLVRAARVLGWMIQPDGTLVQFGDSPERLMVVPKADSIDPETRYVVSDGERGTRPSTELAVFTDGGYAFVRSPQPDGPGTLGSSGYLAFSAAFHSRAHKHADDLNVVWYDRGHQILTDAGRFGYGDLLPADSPLRREGFYYATPQRQYVEGTAAHNTLMVDGQNQQRRTREPYGSGIGECTEKAGVFDLSGRVQHGDYIHRRRVVYRPGRELLLKDSVFSQSAETREGTLWFNVSGHFELESTAGPVVFVASRGGTVTRLLISGPGTLVDPVRGQDAPLRGWRSRRDHELEPTWSLGFTFPIETRAAVETRLRLESGSS